MKQAHVLAGFAIATVASASLAAPLASSNFAAGAEGWIPGNGAQSFTWSAGGGDADGYIQARDIRPDTLWFFSAPAAYLGNVSSAYGGMLSFALKSDSSSPPHATTYADVHLLGQNGVRLALAGDVLPLQSWTPYIIALIANGSWKVDSVDGPSATAADFAGVLSNLKDLRIRGDYRQASEVTGLDSVTLSAAPVPEASGASMWLSGLAVAAVVNRRRQRKRAT